MGCGAGADGGGKILDGEGERELGLEGKGLLRVNEGWEDIDASDCLEPL